MCDVVSEGNVITALQQAPSPSPGLSVPCTSEPVEMVDAPREITVGEQEVRVRRARSRVPMGLKAAETKVGLDSHRITFGL